MPSRALLLACLPLVLSAADAPKPAWETDLEAAFRRARKEDRPVFVVFRCDH